MQVLSGYGATVAFQSRICRASPAVSSGKAHTGCSGLAIADSSSVRKCPRMRSMVARSEEHTSELQSLRHLVCRLLLEKKKNTVGIPRRDETNVEIQSREGDVVC